MYKILTVVSMLVGVSPVLGQQLLPIKQIDQPATIQTLQLDDGFAEAYFFDGDADGELAQRFDLSSTTGTMLSAQLCFFRNNAVGTFEFELKFWTDSAGVPSFSEVASYDLEAANLSSDLDCRTYPINASFSLDTPHLWAGIDWGSESGNFGLAADKTPKASPARIAIRQSGVWQIVSSDSATAVFIRLAVDQPSSGGGGTGACQSSATVLCISDQPGDGRFEVTVSFDTTGGGGASGPARAIALSSLGVNRGGLFWFFGVENPEVLIKVLNGCGINGHYWVFYSAATTVGLDVQVLDTQTGRNWRRINVDGFSAQPVNDVQAFPCQ